MAGALAGVVIAALSLMMMWGSPKTPTFHGTREKRFALAVEYYRNKMGLDQKLVIINDGKMFPDYCAWTQRLIVPNGFEQGLFPERIVIVGFNNRNPHCISYKPELLALHETCHIRMAHNEPLFEPMDSEEKEREARRCTRWYQEGVR